MEIKKANCLTLPLNPSYKEWEKIEEDFGNRWSRKHYRGIVTYPYVQHGDAVDDDIVQYFSTVEEPVTMTDDLIQCGKYVGRGFDKSSYKARRVYHTFKKNNGRWVYCGKCFEGETERQSTDIFANDKERLLQWDLKRLQTFVYSEQEWIRDFWDGKKRSRCGGYLSIFNCREYFFFLERYYVFLDKIVAMHCSKLRKESRDVK